jgi:hypothetical protein
MKLLDNFKKDLIGNLCAALTCVLLIFALAFYAPAVLKNFSAATIVLGILAIAIYVAGMFFDLKGADVLVGAAFTAFCFGFYLIGRLESINLIQVNLSDINTYFYVDLVFFILALVSALATAIVKKTK